MSDKDPSEPRRVQYPRAPITESIINVQFADPVSPELLEKLKAQLSKEYPFVEGWSELAVSFDLATKDTRTDETSKGVRFKSLDNLDVLIAADKQIAVSRLAPYTGWDTFFARARRDWEIFKKLAGYRRISQVGVRYINRIDIPQTGAALNVDEYLLIGPNVPQPPFPPMQNTTMQIRCPTPKGEIICNSARVDSPVVNHHSFVLDIDVIRRIDIPQKDDELWAYITEVRDQKNMLFEACVTDKARALFR